VDHLKRHPRFQQLADYLASKEPPGMLPGRQHVDPIELHRLLPYIILVDVVPADGRWRYRYRLIGTAIVEKASIDVTGQWVEDVYPADAARAIAEAYDGVVRTHVPHHWSYVIRVPGREHIGFERVIFPLARDGKTVDMLIGIHAFNDP
jgi:hypothetical protein